jgi:GTPase SAR1 family protein
MVADPECENGFTHNYLPTLGVNLEKKTIPYKEGKLTICLWDTAG